MPKKPGTLNRFNVHEFLNKYEKRDLKNRDAHAESEVRRHPEFTCECGSRELVDLRPGFGECRECKIGAHV